MQPFGGRFGQAVGQGLEHDRRIVVVGGLEAGDVFVDAEAGRDRKGAGVVLLADEIGQRRVETALRLLDLLAQADPAGRFLAARFVGVEHDVFVLTLGRVEAEHRLGGQPVFADDLGQHGLGIVEQLAGGFADRFVLQDGRVAAGQVPALEEGRPVDIGHEIGERDGDFLATELGRFDRGVGLVPRETIGPGVVQRNQRGALAASVFGAHGFVFGGDFGVVGIALVDGEQLGGDADGARGIRHVNHRAFGVRRDLDRGVGAAGCRAADQQRLFHAVALHLGRDVGHFFQ